MELAVRGVKWLQKMVWGCPAHEQLVGALFGKLRVGGLQVYDALGSGGGLAIDASPYAKMVLGNLDYFRPLETASCFFASWADTGESVRALLSNEGIKTDLGKIPPD